MNRSIALKGLCCVLGLWLLCGTTSVVAQQLIQNALFSQRPCSISGSTTAADGSILSCGFFFDITNDGLVLKTDASGTVLWARSISLSGTYVVLNSVASSADGSIVLTATANENSKIQIPMLICLNADGSMRWSRRYSIETDAQCLHHCITSDGGILAIGMIITRDSLDRTTVSAFILKTDSLGQPLWCKKSTIGTSDQSYYRRVIECRDSSLELTGVTLLSPESPFRFSFEAISLLHLKADGTPVNQSVFLVEERTISAQSLLQSADGSFLVSGTVAAFEGTQTPLLFRLNSDHRIRWAKTVSFFSSEYMQNVIEDGTGTIIGLSLSQDPTLQSMHLCKLDGSGALKAATTLVGRHALNANLNEVAASTEVVSIVSTLAAAQDTASHIEFSTLSRSFVGCNLEPTLCSTSDVTVTDTTIKFVHTAIAVQAISEPVTSTAATFDVGTICSRPLNEVAEGAHTHSLLLHPNPAPANAFVTITFPELAHGLYEVSMRDITGREVYHVSKELVAASEQLQIPTTGLPSGVYMIELLEANSLSNVWRGKVVVE